MPKFAEKEHFLTPDMHARVRFRGGRAGVRNVRFLENLARFVFFKHPF